MFKSLKSEAEDNQMDDILGRTERHIVTFSIYIV